MGGRCSLGLTALSFDRDVSESDEESDEDDEEDEDDDDDEYDEDDEDEDDGVVESERFLFLSTIHYLYTGEYSKSFEHRT